jgi:hypothetical protein
VLVFAVALSVIAATGVGIVLSARIAYGIASYRALPGSLANVSPRFRIPVVATVVASLILLVLGWIYLLTTSVQNTFSYVLNNTGILYATFYCVTALAAVVYYRRRVMSNWRDMLTIGVKAGGRATTSPLERVKSRRFGWAGACCTGPAGARSRYRHQPVTSGHCAHAAHLPLNGAPACRPGVQRLESVFQ